MIEIGVWVRYFGTITKIDRRLNNGYVTLECHNEMQPVHILESDLEIWKPQYGEFCWFWDDGQLDNDGTPHFGRYGVLSYTLEFYDHCEPFIGETPTFYKKRK